MWTNIWLEWLCLQIIILYSLIKLYTSFNYFKQVQVTIILIVLLCLYLSLWQLELFACFLFLGEFTILIFFYCLFLHLKTSVTTTPTISSNRLPNSIVFSSFVYIIYLSTSNSIFSNLSTQLNLVYSDVYQLVNDFTLNDLESLIFFFTTGNIIIHILIGILLTVLTIFLFVTISLYTTLSIKKQNIFSQITMKLFTTKGYYEQNANTIQKYFTTKK